MGLAFIAFLSITCMYRYTRYYDVDRYEKLLDGFIDFLNQINSNLYLGLSLETSILHLNSDQDIKDGEGILNYAIRHLKTAISLGLNGALLLDEIYKLYPIDDCRLYVEMLKLSKETGASINKITEVTLANLYTRFQTVSEAKLILYQKKMEQMILSIAPILIIIFISITSGSFLEMLYTTPIGALVMTSSFALLIVMKIVGRRIVETIK